MLGTDIQGKIYFLIRWAHNLSSLRTSHCEGHWAPTEKAEQRKYCSQGSLKTDVPNENTYRWAHTLLAGHSLDCTQCGKGSGNTLGKVCWVWHEVTAVYPSGDWGLARRVNTWLIVGFWVGKARICVGRQRTVGLAIDYQVKSRRPDSWPNSWFLIQTTTVYEALVLRVQQTIRQSSFPKGEHI